MTYEEYANLTLDKSGMTLCSYPYELRNCTQQNLGSFEYGLYEIDNFGERDATGITGTVALVDSDYQDDVLTECVLLKIGDYVYTKHKTIGGGTDACWIQEYQISTGNKLEIKISEDNHWLIGTGQVNASYIEGRKILCQDLGDYIPNVYNTYVIDFEDMSKTTVHSVPYDAYGPWVEDLCVVKDGYGDIHLCVLGGSENGTSGLMIWHKNYTTDSDWVENECSLAGIDVLSYTKTNFHYQIFDNRYILRVINGVDFDGYVWKICISSYDILTDTHIYNTISNPNENETWFYPGAIDNINKKLYFCVEGWDEDYYSFEMDVDAYSLVASIVPGTADSEGRYWDTLSGRRHAFYAKPTTIYGGGPFQIHSASDGSLLNSYIFENYCKIIDDSGSYGEIVWDYNPSDGYLKAVGLEDGIVKKSFDTGVISTAYVRNISVIHLGDSLMIVLRDTSGGEATTISYYLIT